MRGSSGAGRAWRVCFLVTLGDVLAEDGLKDDFDPDVDGVDWGDGPKVDPREPTYERNVLVLTDKSFDTAIRRHERLVVNFHAPWCHPCKALEPQFRWAAEEAQEDGLNVRLAKLEANEEMAMLARYSITDYPTLIYFRNGTAGERYKGEHMKRLIVEWLHRREGKSPVQEVVQEDLEEARRVFEREQRAAEEDDPAGKSIIHVFARVKKNSVRDRAWREAVEEQLWDYDQAHFRFVVTWLPKGADPKKDATLELSGRVVPSGSGHAYGTMAFDGKWTAEAIAQWAKRATYPLVGTAFKDRYMPRELALAGLGGVVALCLRGEDPAQGPDADIYQSATEMMAEFAALYPKWRFTMCGRGALYQRQSKSLGLQERDDAPVLCAVLGNLENYKHYNLIGAEKLRDRSVVADFLDGVASRRLEPSYLSALPPERERDENNITIITGDTFKRHVMNPTNDVFVLYHSPHDEASRDLLSVWGELARKVSKTGWDERGVIVASFDLTTNECEEEIRHYPRMLLYPAVEAARKMKKKLVYAGARDTGEELSDWLLENAQNLQDVEDWYDIKVWGFQKNRVKSEAKKKKDKQAEGEL